ncbi:MAG: helix-turn-helix domain-containing protein [Saprospiraceae bacterium]|nr:helix-turn-helix domain-containing protein [Saprospiraceae bacterium]
MVPTFRILSGFFLLFAGVLPLSAQHEFYNSQTFGKNIGFSARANSIAEDNEGIYWVGTENGLYRFDGAYARQVSKRPDQNEGFSIIQDLDFDAATNSLWICSSSGFCRYDLTTKQVEDFNPADFFPKGEITQRNKLAYQDRQGEWWGDLNVNGLAHYIPQRKQAEQFVVPEALLKGRNVANLANTILSVEQDSQHDSILWAGTRAGLIRVNKVTKSIQYFYFEHPNTAQAADANAMQRLLSHQNGRLYIGTWNGGLLEFDPATQRFRQFFPNLSGYEPHTTANLVHTLFLAGPEALWAGTGVGICRFDLREPGFSQVKKGKPLNYRDKKGNYWGFYDGLVLYERLRNQNPRIPFPEAQEFRMDLATKKVYCKNFSTPGIWEFNTIDNSLRGLPLPGTGSKATNGSVLELTAMGLLTNDMERLYLLPKGESRFVPLFTAPADAGWLSSVALPDGGALICGEQGYLIHFKPGNRTPALYPPDLVSGGNPDLKNGIWVTSVDQWGRAWVRASGGFLLFDSKNGQFLRFPYKEMPDKIFPDIRALCPDNQGRMWCAGPSELGYLDQAHPERGIVQRYKAAGGLDFTDIGYLQISPDGNIWVSCWNGLIRFTPASGSHRIYRPRTRTHSFLPDGNLLACYWDGFFITHPDSLLSDTTPPRPYATWFKVLDKEKTLLGSLFAPDEIRLSPQENFISIGFSALGFLLPSKYQFAYQLVGVNDDWVNADADNLVAAYTALPGGDYVFRLKVRNATGHWTQQPYELRIHIATPWYRSWLAWLAYAGLTIWAAWRWLRARERQLIVQQRLQEEQREAGRLKELDHFKNRFFTNITHEFRTPLTVILGVAADLESETRAQQTLPGLQTKVEGSLPLIRRNGQRLLELVNQMLALSRIDAGALPVQLLRNDVMPTLRILVEAFHSYAVSQKIGLQFHADPEHFEMDFDPELLQRLLSNLIANALKFTEEYGNVLVSAKPIREQEGSEWLQLEVRDSGIGIAPEHIPFLFDRFYQSGAAPLRGEESSGIGLALVKEIVNLLNGRIEVASTPERGSIFRVWLPVSRLAEKQQPEASGTTLAPALALPLPHNTEARSESLPLILVIEDNADVLDYIHSCLYPDWQVLTARNGTLGLAVAQAELPDVIISDVMMPGMDGFALTAAIKADLRTSHIPVLLLSAKSTRADIIEGLSKGADDYLVKPFDKTELLLRLRNFHQQQLRWQNKPAAPEAPDPMPPAERSFLNKVDAAIEAQLDQLEFKAEHLARALALSRVQLHRKLTALTGASTGLYIRRYRLQRARQLLETTDLPVSEVAWKVGFENLSWFSQAYREEFGISPRETRQ